jgi:hypothetical protein
MPSGPGALRLRVLDRAGNETVWEARTTARSAVLPRRMELGANYPNPFNPATTIPYATPTGTGFPVRLAVYTVSGQLVRELVARAEEPGRHQVRWDGRDQAGRPVSSGVYLYRLEMGPSALNRRMTLLK